MLFLLAQFCVAKPVACRWAIKRARKKRRSFLLHSFPSLRWAGVQTTKPVGNHKKKHHPSGWCFLFGMPRAGLNSLPRPARSALNQEVRQGSCEWLCHSWDAGKRVRASSILLCRARKIKKNRPLGGFPQAVEKACYCEPVRAAKQVPLGYSSE